MRARSQEQAAVIYALVERIRDDERKEQKRYGALCHRFPLLVRESGLVAALGFLAAKDGGEQTPEGKLLAHYAEALGYADGDGEALRGYCVACDLAEYRRLTRAALQAAEWFKRYAEAVLKVDASGASTQDEPKEEDHA